MNCVNHPELEAAAYCRECGKPMCGECRQQAMGSVYCAEHLPVAAPPPLPSTPAPYSASFANAQQANAQQASAQASAGIPPYTAPQSPYMASAVPVQDTSVHPVLAALLGFVPGVGAIYNGQYAKGLVHAVVFGLMISLIEHSRGDMEPLFGVLLAAWVFYMVFEAYHTARKRRHGIAVEEFSSLIDVKAHSGSRFPTGAVVLIVVGLVLLLNTTDIIDFAIVERFWPVGLIALGLYMLYSRMNSKKDAEARQ